MAIQVRVDNMAGTTLGTYLRNIRFATFADGTYTPAEVENGMVVKIEGLIPGHRDLFWAVAPSVNDKLEDLALVTSVEVEDDPRKRNFSDYTNVANSKARCHKFHKNDFFSVTREAFVNTTADAPAEGDLVEVAAGCKYGAVSTLTVTGDSPNEITSTQVGKLIAIEKSQGATFYVVEV